MLGQPPSAVRLAKLRNDLQLAVAGAACFSPILGARLVGRAALQRCAEHWVALSFWVVQRFSAALTLR